MQELDQPAERPGVNFTAILAAVTGFQIGTAVSAITVAIVGVRFFGNRLRFAVAGIAQTGPRLLPLRGTGRLFCHRPFTPGVTGGGNRYMIAADLFRTNGTIHNRVVAACRGAGCGSFVFTDGGSGVVDHAVAGNPYVAFGAPHARRVAVGILRRVGCGHIRQTRS